MDSTKLDKIFKERLSQAECAPTDDLWQGIMHKMAVRRRRRIVFRIAGGVSAVAACLAAGLILFRGEHMSSDLPQAHSPIAESVLVEPSNEIVDDVADIRSQIESLSSVMALAQNDMPSCQSSGCGLLSAKDLLSDTPSDDVIEETQEFTSIQQETPSNSDATVADQTNNVQEFWNAIEREDAMLNQRGHAPVSVTLSTSSGARLSSVQQAAVAAPSYSPAFFSSLNAPVIEQQGDAHYSLPLTFAVRVGVPITDQLTLAPAISYSYLETSFDALVKKEKFQGTSRQLHYVGVGLAADYNWLSLGDFLIYSKLGFNAEKCVKSRYVYGSAQVGLDVKGLQWSLLAGAGVEYKLGRNLGIYADPSLNYYFDNDQPGSIRTDHPLMVGLELGLRFNL